MTKLSILIDNVQKEVDSLRYYDNNGVKYFIFTLGELDENNYEKLYAVKIINLNGVLTATNIVDDNEWNSVKDTIKIIIKSNKEGVKVVNDLDASTLINLAVSETRIFKLNKQLADLLGENSDESSAPKSIGLEPVAEPTQVAMPEPVAPTIMPEMQPSMPVEPVMAPTPQTIVAPEPQASINPYADLGLAPSPTVAPIPVTPTIEVPVAETVAPISLDSMTAMPTNMTPAQEEDYKRLYEEEKERVQGLTLELVDLQEKLKNIKNLIN